MAVRFPSEFEVGQREVHHTPDAPRQSRVVGWQGKFRCDTSKPDGAPRKLLDVGRLHRLGWRHRIGLREGIESTYDWFRQNYDRAVLRPEAQTATV